MSEYQCADCRRHFAGPLSFDRHKATNLQCLSVDAMHVAGLRLDHRSGVWTLTTADPASRAQLDQINHAVAIARAAYEQSMVELGRWRKLH